MKRTLFFICFFLFAIPALAKNTLAVYQKDGQQFCFGFDEKPVITYSDTLLVLKTIKTEVQYPLSSLVKFSFSDIETSVVDVENQFLLPQFQLEYYMLSITGASPDINVSVISEDGKLLSTYKTDSNGNVSFSIVDLPEGVYIIRSESLTCKILKK